MNAEERDLLHRHLNGDLDASEQASFFARLQASPALRRELASHAMDETLLSELVLEGRTAKRPASRRRGWIPGAIAASMLIGLTLILTLGRGASMGLRVVSSEGEARVVRAPGAHRDPHPGLEILKGDMVFTEQGRLLLQGAAGSVELGKGTSVATAEGFKLLRGSLEVQSEGMEVKTERGVALLRKAKARLEYVAEELRVETEEGSVLVGATEIPAGRYARIGTTVQSGRLVKRSLIDDAVQRAVSFLRSRRSEIVAPMVSEKRHGSAPRRSYAELALFALHRAGVPDSDPLKAELLGLVKGRPIESTYAAALQAMALVEIDPIAHQDRVRLCAQLLVDSQCVNGQWDYGLKPPLGGPPLTFDIRRRQEGPASGDNSVTSYAVLGLSACTRGGIFVDADVVTRARSWWVKCQNADGGWGYNDSGSQSANDAAQRTLTTNASYGSATASAVASLSAIRGMREEDSRIDALIGRGTAWLAANFSSDRNPGKDPGFTQLHWLLSAARAGMMLGTERFGSHEWYAEGAEFLLQAQRPSGEWAVEQGDFMRIEKNDVLDTCLAILFLKRAP